jgi:hypothetical protein
MRQSILTSASLTLVRQSLAGADHDRHKRPKATRTSGEAGGLGDSGPRSRGDAVAFGAFSRLQPSGHGKSVAVVLTIILIAACSEEDSPGGGGESGKSGRGAAAGSGADASAQGGTVGHGGAGAGGTGNVDGGSAAGGSGGRDGAGGGGNDSGGSSAGAASGVGGLGGSVGMSGSNGRGGSTGTDGGAECVRRGQACQGIPSRGECCESLYCWYPLQPTLGDPGGCCGAEGAPCSIRNDCCPSHDCVAGACRE